MGDFRYALGDPLTGLGFCDPDGRSRGESLGERLLGSLLDRAHLMPARLVGPLVAQEIAASPPTSSSPSPGTRTPSPARA